MSSINTIQFYNPGEKIWDIWRKKSGIIRYLRNDEHEKNCRHHNPSHHYYFVDYDDGTFDTYVSGNDFKKFNDMPHIEYNSVKPSYDLTKKSENLLYNPGQKFINKFNQKTGTIRYLRNDEHEKNFRLTNPTHYYYHVDYDDGSFETYESASNLIII